MFFLFIVLHSVPLDHLLTILPFSDADGDQIKLRKILLNGNNICMVCILPLLMLNWLGLMIDIADSWWWGTGLTQHGHGGDELIQDICKIPTLVVHVNKKRKHCFMTPETKSIETRTTRCGMMHWWACEGLQLAAYQSSRGERRGRPDLDQINNYVSWNVLISFKNL